MGYKIDLKALGNDELLSFRIELERELHSRGLVFSVGEIGEAAAIKYFNVTPGLSNLIAAPHGAKNVDALSRNGDRYSIKTIQRARKTGTVYPDEIDRDKQLFEFLLIAMLGMDYSLERLYRFSWAQFLTVRAWDKRMNAWYVPVTGHRLAQGTCLLEKDGKPLPG